MRTLLLTSVGLILSSIVAQTRLPSTICSGRGLMNSNLICSCFGGFRGPDCSLRYCPTGRAWSGFPMDTNEAHSRDVECSNMGTCDRVTGTCQCRDGFEGQACERVACPLKCSGHGRCLSMAEAASEWDGRTLVRPNVEYTSVWDAHALHGCACDPGWSGHDCSQLECPRGDDPLTTGQANEVIRLVCGADGGSFVFSFRGDTSGSIPFDASYGYVEHVLEQMDTIADVEVSVASVNGSVCGRNEVVVTTVEFLQDFGDLPAALVSSSNLELGGGEAILALESLTEIVCPACPSCSGAIYLVYDDEATSSISVHHGAAEIESVLLRLKTISVASVYGNMTSVNVSTTGGRALCDPSAEVTTAIRLRCPFGNLPSFTMISSVRDSYGEAVGLNITDGKGTKENEYCSNHGVCSFDSGTCVCDRNTTRFPDEWYWWESSDGYGGPGGRGDCGHQRVESATNTTQGCPVGVVFMNESTPMYETMDKVVCSGKGACNNETGGCVCYPGFYGGDCSQRRCLTGKAWFDEARANNAAHSYGAECGAMGICDHKSGECVCREGWTGAACERLACADDCSGNGACLPMYRLAQLRERNGNVDPVVYGISDLVRPWGSSVYASPETWDFDMVYGCLCDSGARGFDDNDGGFGGVFRRRAGTRGYVSGVYTDNELLPGWAGYKCHQRTCPTGDDLLTSPGVFETQTVACTLSSGTFRITFRQESTEDITFNATRKEVAAAMELLPTIGSVSVDFTSGDLACDSTWIYGEGIQVTFLTELGALPEMETTPPFSVNRTVAGTKENAECGGHGICDFSTGVCTCVEGWGSSDGDGAMGNRGDCGYHYDFCTDKTQEDLTDEETFAILQATR